MKAAKPKVSKHRLDAIGREVSALQLRQAGLSYQRIADRLGYSNRSGAWHAVRAGLTATLQEPADELRGLELERLDRLHEAVWDKAIAGHLRSVDTVLSIMRRRSALLGLDAPRQVAVSLEATTRAMADKLAARWGLDPAALIAEAEWILAEMRGDGGR
jgi:hypothetical protein